MSAKLIVSFKDSLMGVPAGLHYKLLANDQEIDNAVVPERVDIAITYDFKDNGQQVIVSSSNDHQITINKSSVYHIILQLLSETGELEKIIGFGLLADGMQLTVVVISPWTKIPLSLQHNESFSGNFFDIDYNIKNDNNRVDTVRVVIKDLPRKIVLTALKYRHSTKWAGSATVTSTHPVLGKSVTFNSGTNKCNVFVNDVLTEVGISVAWIEHGKSRYIPFSVSGLSPPIAGEWANSSLLRANWEAVTTSMPGDIGAYAVNYSNASGHVGIVVTDGVTISAGWYRVEVNDVGFRHKNGTASSDDHDFSIFRRYKGTL